MDIQEAQKKFSETVSVILENFIEETDKIITNRIKELFCLFENDIIELDRKRFMLTHFDEIAIKDNNGLSLINARKLKKSWICCVEKNYIEEAKINEFLLKANQKNCIKKIVIALDGIEANARLKALEDKVWI